MKVVKAYSKTVIYWDCPNCNHHNEIEDRFDKAISDTFECDNCYEEFEYEMEE